MLLTEQYIFDTVVDHLATQGYRAGDNQGCFYRAPDGSKCAVGALITDEEYDPQMDTLCGPVTSVADCGLLPERLLPHVELLRELQIVHDDWTSWANPHNLRGGLRDVANKFNLNTEHLEETEFKLKTRQEIEAIRKEYTEANHG